MTPCVQKHIKRKGTMYAKGTLNAEAHCMQRHTKTHGHTIRKSTFKIKLPMCKGT